MKGAVAMSKNNAVRVYQPLRSGHSLFFTSHGNNEEQNGVVLKQTKGSKGCQPQSWQAAQESVLKATSACQLSRLAH